MRDKKRQEIKNLTILVTLVQTFIKHFPETRLSLAEAHLIEFPLLNS